MISSVTLTQGALRMAREQVIVKTSAGDPELRQHRHPVQRQDRHADERRDALRSGRRSGRSGVAAAVHARLHQQPLRDRASAVRSMPPSCSRPPSTSAGYQKVDEIPFDFERRRLSVVVEAPDGAGRRLLITKGAPEPILAAVHGDRSGRAGRAARRADDAQACTAVHERMSADGLRVLAVAYRWLEPSRRLLARRRGRPRARGLRQLRRSGPAGCRRTCWRSSSATASP